MSCSHAFSLFFFFNDTATTEIYTLSLHDALPISPSRVRCRDWQGARRSRNRDWAHPDPGRASMIAAKCKRTCSGDRKSTRLNSSHGYISYAVFCLKKKKDSTSDNAHHAEQLEHIH